MNPKLLIIKSHLYDKIDPMLNYVFDEAFNDLTKKLANTRFVTDESVEEAFVLAEDLNRI